MTTERRRSTRDVVETAIELARTNIKWDEARTVQLQHPKPGETKLFCPICRRYRNFTFTPEGKLRCNECRFEVEEVT